mmetsp:Transcript_31821/g.95693  ORF Transcript_31821/g.95693 Transcript_31821/m.95693 type:complete len:422 (-) Transcript_31821:167-1432(-)
MADDPSKEMEGQPPEAGPAAQAIDLDENKAFLFKSFPVFEAKYREQKELTRQLNRLEGEIGRQLPDITAKATGMEAALKVALDTAADRGDTQNETDYVNLAREFERVELVLRQISLEQPKPAGTAVKTVLGGVNVSLRTMVNRFDYKDEYEHFKLKYTISIIGVAALLLLFPRSPILFSALQFVLMGYYLIVTLREEVLITNGSRIRLWWRTHHYLSFLQSGLLFSWAETDENADFRYLFIVFSLYIGLIQVAQFYYQSRSLYYKRAFPPVSTILREPSSANPLRSTSTPHGDMMATTSDLPRGESLVGIVVALGVAYVFQLYNAYHLVAFEWPASRAWQIPCLSAIFATLGLGNIRTTVVVLFKKAMQYRGRENVHRKAIENYESFHNLPAGTVSLAEVTDTPEGIKGWAQRKEPRKKDK